MSEKLFEKEADLCAAFIESVVDENEAFAKNGRPHCGWDCYPETGGWDILVVRQDDGFQIGVEAKLKLNPKVVCQALESGSYFSADSPGPDARAVLVPSDGLQQYVAPLCARIGITVIKMSRASFRPSLPLPPSDVFWTSDDWHETGIAERIKLPDYKAEVPAGVPSPIQLTPWKISALRLLAILDQRGFVCRSDLRHLEMSPTRWIGPHGWLRLNPERGGYVATDAMPDFRAQHPGTFAQIVADYEDWAPPSFRAPRVQGALL